MLKQESQITYTLEASPSMVASLLQQSFTRTQIPHAVGAAYSLKMDKKKACAMTFFGDGSSSEGDLHAAMNFAASMEAPVIFICRNNGWEISTPSSEQYRGDGIVVRGPAYGIKSICVAGNDALTMYSAVSKARQIAIKESKPVLIEVREKDLPQTPVSFPSVQLQKQTAGSSSKVCKMKSERTLSRGSASKAAFLHLKDKVRSGESSKASSSMINLKTPGESTNGDRRRACLLFQFHEENIIVEGRVMEVGPDERIHNEPMKHGCLKVSIDETVNEDAYLIYPT